MGGRRTAVSSLFLVILVTTLSEGAEGKYVDLGKTPFAAARPTNFCFRCGVQKAGRTLMLPNNHEQSLPKGKEVFFSIAFAEHIPSTPSGKLI